MGLFSGLRRILGLTPALPATPAAMAAALADGSGGSDPVDGILKAASKGEKQLLTLFPSYSSFGLYANWSANRGELVQHFKGWNYVAIKAICEEIAGLSPQVADVVTGQDIAKAKARVKAISDPWRRVKAWGELRDDYRMRLLSRRRRHKSLATVQQDDELEPAGNDDPLVRLLRNPNGPDTAWTFFYRMFMYLELTGSTYIWVVKNRMREPSEMWVLPSQWVRPRSGGGKLIEYYDIRPMAGYVTQDWGGGWFPGGSGNFEIDADDIIWIHYPHPVAAYFDGYAPISAMSEWIDVSENIDRSRVAHFRNGMFPGVAVEIDKEIIDPSPANIARLQADIAERYQGVRQNKKPIVLGPGMKLVPFTQTAQEMDYVNSANQSKSWQLAGHRVGESMAGLAENTTFASMYAARANFYTSTITPKLRMVGQALSEKLVPRFTGEDGDSERVRGGRAAEAPRRVIYWEDATPVDPDFDLKKWTAAMEKGAATPNEFRREILDLPGYENGGDDPLVVMGMSPLPINSGEAPEEMPVPAVAAERWDEETQGQVGKSPTDTKVAGAADGGEPGKPIGAEEETGDSGGAGGSSGFAKIRESLSRNLLKPGGSKAVRGWWNRSANGHSNGVLRR